MLLLFVIALLQFSATVGFIPVKSCPGDGLITKCTCGVDAGNELTLVNCSGTQLTTLPSIPSTVNILDLSFNPLLRLETVPDNYHNLLTIVLRGCGISEITPQFFRPLTRVNHIDLSHNQLQSIPSVYSALPAISQMDLSYNKIVTVNSFEGEALTALYMDHNLIETVHDTSFSNLTQLRYLSLRNNRIKEMSEQAFTRALTHLSLGFNGLSSVPQLHNLAHTLQALAIESNMIRSMDGIMLYKSLQNCTLVSNLIEKLPLSSNLSPVLELILRSNNISEIQYTNFKSFPALQHLDLSDNKISNIPELCFSPLTKLVSIDLSYNKVERVAENSFKKMLNLQTCSLNNNRISALTSHFSAASKLRTLDLNANQLAAVPTLPSNLYLVYLAKNKITKLSLKDFRYSKLLLEIDLSDNRVEVISQRVFSVLPALEKLYVNRNKIRLINLENCTRLNYLDAGANYIEDIPPSTFRNTAIKTLYLDHNSITKMTNDSLAPIDGLLKYLDLSFNGLEYLSHQGLSSVSSMNLDGNPDLTNLPREGLHTLEEVTVAFPVMCCWFRKIKRNSVVVSKQDSTIKETGYWNDRIEQNIVNPPTEYLTGPTGVTGVTGITGVTGTSTSSPITMSGESQYVHLSVLHRQRRDERSSYTTHIPSTTGQAQVEILSFDDIASKSNESQKIVTLTARDDTLRCVPEPDEFSPCEDLIGNWVLRVGVWLVCTLAVVGNLFLFIVTLLSTNRFTATRFLILNLSFSDLFMGIYLSTLAVVDAHTYGIYEEFAMDWQRGLGCKVSGFMAMFSSELSVYTLAVISVERMVAIIFYFDPDKHLKTRHIAVAMFFGWIISLASATLPLIGVSDYSLVAICLPFQTSSPDDLGFIMTVLVINVIAITIISYSYLKIFSSVRHLQKPLDNADFRETLRMALIILTDVICWVPIALFGLTAAFDVPLITTSKAKILVVFILPLNACANPFLYSLARPRFKEDFLFICSKLGMCKIQYYITSRRKSGIDLEIKNRLRQRDEDERSACISEIRKCSYTKSSMDFDQSYTDLLQKTVGELRKPSQDSSTSSSGYSSG